MGDDLAFGNPRFYINGDEIGLRWGSLTSTTFSKPALPLLRGDIDRLLDAYRQINKYHRKTNYKPKYTL